KKGHIVRHPISSSADVADYHARDIILNVLITLQFCRSRSKNKQGIRSALKGKEETKEKEGVVPFRATVVHVANCSFSNGSVLWRNQHLMLNRIALLSLPLARGYPLQWFLEFPHPLDSAHDLPGMTHAFRLVLVWHLLMGKEGIKCMVAIAFFCFAVAWIDVMINDDPAVLVLSIGKGSGGGHGAGSGVRNLCIFFGLNARCSDA
ncbi:hypothetical protein B0J11DRAFT_109442, partial [Dendryphion nanum]